MGRRAGLVGEEHARNLSDAVRGLQHDAYFFGRRRITAVKDRVAVGKTANAQLDRLRHLSCPRRVDILSS